MKQTFLSLAVFTFLLAAHTSPAQAHGRISHQTTSSPPIDIAMHWDNNWDDDDEYEDDDWYDDEDYGDDDWYDDDEYEDDWDDDDHWDDDISFEEEKQWILEDFQYILDEEDLPEDVYSTIQSGLAELQNLSDEDAFFDRLDAIEEQLEPYFEELYGEEEEYEDDDWYDDDEYEDDDWYNEDGTGEWEDGDWDDYVEVPFEEEKQWILEEIQSFLDEENINNETLRQFVTDAYAELSAIDDEDTFFDRLEALEEEIEPYLEELYGEDWDEDFEDEYEEGEDDDNVSFEEEREWIIEDLTDVQREIDDVEVRRQVRTLTEELRTTEDEEHFYEKLEEIDLLLEPYYEQFFDDDHFHEAFEGEYEGDTFSVDGDTVDGELSAEQQKVWDRFIGLIPIDQRTDLAEVMFFNEPEDGTAAFVEQLEGDETAWRLGINMAEAGNPEDLDHTLIHEFAHILTLNQSQVDVRGERFEHGRTHQCTTFHTGEGCSTPNSYIHQFTQKFWTGLQKELEAAEDIEDDDAYYTALDAFYQKYADQFVTDYAASNPGEDIAESFTAFVLRSKPTGNTVAEQKILFFYNFDELVELRGKIRSGL